MIVKYYTLGELNDLHGTGLTLACYTQDNSGNWVGVMRTADGEPFLGYMPNEVSESRFNELKQQITRPDMVNYYPGKFPGVGVVDKPTYTKLQKEQDKIVKAQNKEAALAQSTALKAEQALCKKLGVTADELRILARVALTPV
jgi:hypothetical protein